MRFLLFALLTISLSSCSVWNSVFKSDGNTPEAMAEVPTDLEAPAYDPATSPVPMTQNTVLPQPPTAQQPAAYGSNPSQPEAYGSTPVDPAAYPPATTPLSAQVAKGGEAPAAYGSSAAAATGYIDAMLSGLWVNSADSLEIIEFATDHYTAFYQGEMLFREPMTYHNQCPGDCNDGQPMEIACFTVSGPAGTDCYGIIRLTPDVLELSMLGVSTETIVYRKR